jgi:hypothetical protein
MGKSEPTLREGSHGCTHSCPECRLGGVAIACRICGTELIDKPPHETWLEVPLDGSWIAAYRVVPQEGRPVVAEVRVFPDENAPRPQGRWSAERLGDQAPVPVGGVPARVLRQLRVREHLSLYDEIVQRYHPSQSFRVSLLEHGFTRVMKEAGHRRRSDLFYAEIASAYVRLTADRAPIRRLREELEREGGLYFAEATVRDFVNRARRRGLLTPSPPGRPGGELTPKAQVLLRQLAEDRQVLAKRRRPMKMRNPGDGSVGETNQQAFEKVWQPKGWTLVEDTTESEEQS